MVRYGYNVTFDSVRLQISLRIDDRYPWGIDDHREYHRQAYEIPQFNQHNTTIISFP
jgi:hypothetical protein